MILIVGQNLAWQKVCALPRLAPGEVNRVVEMREFASSKGPNVARALAGIGGAGEVIGYTGGATGRRVEEYLTAERISCCFVKIAAETRTCTTLVEPDGTSTEVIEPSPSVTPAEREELQIVFKGRLGAARLLILMGTAVAGEAKDCYARLVRAAHEAGVPVVMDSVSAEAQCAMEESPEVLKINANELGQLARMPVEEADGRVAACRQLSARFGIRWFLISRGRAGIEAFDGKRLLHAIPPAVNVANAIGSGDAAAAGVGWVLFQESAVRAWNDVFLSEQSIREALVTATAMGTANCLNPINGKVVREDFLAIRERIRVEEVPIPRSERSTTLPA